MAKKSKDPITVENFDLEKFLKKELRRAFKKSPLYNEAKKRAKVYWIEYSKHGKPMERVGYTCAECKKMFLDRVGQKDIAVDHIIPVEDLEHGWQGPGIYVERLFCHIDNLQVLCNYKGERDGLKSCHKIKTAEEAAIRAKFKKGKK